MKKPITETKGRGLYLRVRNAHEILAKMNFADHKKRPQQIAKLRDGGVPLIHLGRIGCSVKDLLKAGIEASELKAAGINVRRSILFHRGDSTAEGDESSGHLSGHMISGELILPSHPPINPSIRPSICSFIHLSTPPPHQPATPTQRSPPHPTPPFTWFGVNEFGAQHRRPRGRRDTLR